MLGEMIIDTVLNMASTNCRSLQIHLTKEVSGTKEV
jgi:hypothetical protein